jgi:hypothetical protein
MITAATTRGCGRVSRFRSCGSDARRTSSKAKPPAARCISTTGVAAPTATQSCTCNDPTPHASHAGRPNAHNDERAASNAVATSTTRPASPFRTTEGDGSEKDCRAVAAQRALEQRMCASMHHSSELAETPVDTDTLSMPMADTLCKPCSTMSKWCSNRVVTMTLSSAWPERNQPCSIAKWCSGWHAAGDSRSATLRNAAAAASTMHASWPSRSCCTAACVPPCAADASIARSAHTMSVHRHISSRTCCRAYNACTAELRKHLDASEPLDVTSTRANTTACAGVRVSSTSRPDSPTPREMLTH